ncbi:MAG: phospho-sugar mutase [Deltaproteobacteria bacterium]|jgi:phosphomannomutase|nr:phospho-sugar mutase [Deltaproteobacteria bacterium]
MERDPDPETRAELQALIDANDLAALEERFSGTLEFGTAGLRGLLGAGPTRMNRMTVSQATAGLCAWLAKEVPDAAIRGLCVGRDARPNSDVFEQDVVEVATAAGISTFVFTELVPTPVLAFASLRLRAAGGVMITASHNPPGYNGYKVYAENAAQIIPPSDAAIASEIARAAAGPIARLPRVQARASGLVREIDAVRAEYVAAIADEVKPDPDRAPLRIAYTALHGVAERTLRAVLSRAGFDDVHSVAEQAAPDGRFPTVDFPNPEEPGAMDLVLALGAEVDADLVLANDPDGDRVAVAVRGAEGFQVLSGNDVGVLLADDLLRQTDAPRPVVLSTIVSSPMLGPVAASHGARWEQTLTGHKWIQNRALELEREGYTYIFGYEEALGYAASALVRDKDGISAALRLADLASRLKAEGKTLLDARDALWRKHGFFADRQVSVRFEGPGAQLKMRDIVERVRANPPKRIAGIRVVRISEPDATVLVFDLEGGHRAMLRPSGTEPKLKYYFYALGRVEKNGDLDAAKATATLLLQRIADDFTAQDER